MNVPGQGVEPRMRAARRFYRPLPHRGACRTERQQSRAGCPALRRFYIGSTPLAGLAGLASDAGYTASPMAIQGV